MTAKGWTLQSLIDGNMKVTAYCHAQGCRRYQVLDLEKLRDRFGPDAPAMAVDLQPKLRCSACRGREVGLIYTAGDRKPEAPPAKNLYAKAKGG